MLTDVKLYRQWFQFTNWTINKLDCLPKRKRYTLSDRIENTTLDILEQIIRSVYSKDRITALESINLKLDMLITFWRLCYENKWISIRNYEYISEQLTETGKLAGGWIRNEKNRKSL